MLIAARLRRISGQEGAIISALIRFSAPREPARRPGRPAMPSRCVRPAARWRPATTRSPPRSSTPAAPVGTRPTIAPGWPAPPLPRRWTDAATPTVRYNRALSIGRSNPIRLGQIDRRDDQRLRFLGMTHLAQHQRTIATGLDQPDHRDLRSGSASNSGFGRTSVSPCWLAAIRLPAARPGVTAHATHPGESRGYRVRRLGLGQQVQRVVPAPLILGLQPPIMQQPCLAVLSSERATRGAA